VDVVVLPSLAIFVALCAFATMASNWVLALAWAALLHVA